VVQKARSDTVGFDRLRRQTSNTIFFIMIDQINPTGAKSRHQTAQELQRPQQIAFSTAKSTRFAVETANSKSHPIMHFGLRKCVWASSKAFEPSTISRSECYFGAKAGRLARALSSRLLVVMNSVRAHCDSSVFAADTDVFCGNHGRCGRHCWCHLCGTSWR
jgi:hypothetical protein